MTNLATESKTLVSFDIGITASAKQISWLFIHNNNPLSEEIKIIEAIANLESYRLSLRHYQDRKAIAKIEKDIQRWEKLLIGYQIQTTEQALSYLEKMHRLGINWKESRNQLFSQQQTEREQLKQNYLREHARSI